ncbi:MAG: phosphoribosyltransferase [Mycobacterium sp.]
MTNPGSDEDLRKEITVALSRAAYFHNIAGPGPGICPVCRGPAPTTGLCSTCSTTQANLHGATCDHTFFLAYADGYNPDAWSQSAHTMRQYKAAPAPQQCVEDVHMLTLTETWLHDPCIRAAEGGGDWDVATYVPSKKRTGLHPVTGVALNVARIAADDPDDGCPRRIKRVSLACGPVDAARVANIDRFTVPDAVRPVVEGKRVLLVDDTWTTGTSLQSAAAALKSAGAASVTGLCVARWLSWRWEPDAVLLRDVTAAPYDPFRCLAGTHQCRLRSAQR